jgi:hypothetical protein
MINYPGLQWHGAATRHADLRKHAGHFGLHLSAFRKSAQTIHMDASPVTCRAAWERYELLENIDRDGFSGAIPHNMFVRFRQTLSSLQVSLVETRRIDGKVRHEHVAGLGSIVEPMTVADRVAFWSALYQRLAKLSNRIDAEAHAKVLGSVHAREKTCADANLWPMSLSSLRSKNFPKLS